MKSFLLLLFMFCAVCAGYAQRNDAQKMLPKDLRKTLSFIPGGKAVLEKDTAVVTDFFILKTEVSQKEYGKFLAYLRQSNDQEKLRIAAIDSTAWRSIGAYNEPLVTYYHSHPAYADYPIVNISYEAALAYCAWYEIELNKQLQGKYTAKVSLPTAHEWIRAVRGDNHHFVYAWGGPYLRNAKAQTLCNYVSIGDESIARNPETRELEVKKGAGGGYMGVAGYLNDNAEILALVYAYPVNGFGLYNMNGNAREMTAAKGTSIGGSWRDTGYDVRNESLFNYTTLGPDLGFRPIVRLQKGN